MHGDMGGYYEIRVTGPGREQYRLFCLLENADKHTLTARGLRGPAIAVITGMRKKAGTVFSERDYAKVRQLGSDHTAQTPRHIASGQGSRFEISNPRPPETIGFAGRIREPSRGDSRRDARWRPSKDIICREKQRKNGSDGGVGHAIDTPRIEIRL